MLEVSADAIRGRGHLLDDLLELLDHLLRFADRLFLRGNFRADEKQVAAIPIVRRDGSENKIECFEQTQLALARAIFCVFEFFAALVVHRCEYKPRDSPQIDQISIAVAAALGHRIWRRHGD